jgi:phosphatidate cytidylyltransferase
MSSGALTQRAIGSLLILPVAAVALFPPVGTLAVTVLLIALAAREAAKILTKVLGGASAFWITIILVSPLFAAVSPALGAALTIATLLLFVGTVIRQAVRASEKRLEPELRLLLGTMAAVIWLSPLTLLPLLASLDPLDRGAPARWIVWLLAIVWTADSAAYLVGRTIGRRKLAPVLSPRKSLEGFIGGILVAGLVGALIAGPLFTLGTPEEVRPLWGLVWGLIIATAAEAGDLLESLFKRVAGAESASNLIPGHGGVLDRIDSLLLAAPVTLIAALILRG